jgi:hypothetical protein
MSVPALRLSLAATVMILIALPLGAQTVARQVHLTGVVNDIAGTPVAGATIYVRKIGSFLFQLMAGFVLPGQCP